MLFYLFCFSFVKSTRGDFTYIKAQYVLDCFDENALIDIDSVYPDDVDGQPRNPNAGQPKYVMQINRSLCVKNRMANITRFMERQRSGDTRPLGTTAVGRKRRLRKPRQLQREYIRKYMRNYREKRTARNLARKTDNTGKRVTKLRRQYNKFMRSYHAKLRADAENLAGKFSFKFESSSTNSARAAAWRLKRLKSIRIAELQRSRFMKTRCAREKLHAAKLRLSSR